MDRPKVEEQIQTLQLEIEARQLWLEEDILLWKLRGRNWSCLRIVKEERRMVVEFLAAGAAMDKRHGKYYVPEELQDVFADHIADFVEKHRTEF